jgi:uncharacterized protein (DUF1697 family)
MTHYVAMLRAINVGGRVVKMDDLKHHLAMPGFRNISTYIQSGNVIFDHAETNKALLESKIEAKLLEALGYEVKTFIKAIPAELQAIVMANPFKKMEDDMAVYVSFMSVVPDAALVKQLMELQSEAEQFRIAGTEAYICVKKGTYGETKFSNTFLEKKLKVQATTRNWATVNKLMAL